MENSGYALSMANISKIGVDIAGNGKAHKKRSKYKPTWNVVLKDSTLEMSELTKNFRRGASDVNDAVREGALDLVEQAISKAKKNRSLDDLDDTGLSNLHHAVRYNRVDAVASLLKHGAQVNIQTRSESNTPLHISSRYGWLETSKLLLGHGANPNIKNMNGSSPLHLACKRGNKLVVKLLLEALRIEVNIQDKSSMVPLHVAAMQGDGELCNMLMDKGADYQAQADDKMTPLLAAVANGNRVAANAILEKVIAVSGAISSIMRARDIDSNTILHLAALTNNLEIAEKIIQYEQNVNLPTNSFVTPLHVATVKGHLDMVKLLVSNGADIHAKSFDGRTSLHKAATFGYKHVINFLLEKGAVVDARDYSNRTPFLVAVECGQTESALLLLSKGATINAYDAMVKNCIHLAIENEHLETLKAIVDIEGCMENLYSPDIQERVPLHYAAMCSNIKVLQTILTKQARFAFQDENQQTPMYLAAEAGRADHVEALGRAGSPVNERDDEGKSALHAAAAKRHKKVCLKLLKLGADINYRDNSRSTPLMCAAKTGALKTCEVLLENGAQIDYINIQGNTALLEATRYNRVNIVEMLLDSGASILIRNNQNMSVIDVAVKWGSSDVALAVSKHPRWKEVLNDKSGLYGHSPMKLLIAHFPDSAKVIMDLCIYPVEQTSPAHPDYAVNYDFTHLDPGPDDPASIRGKRYFGPQTMVESSRSELLLHPLTQMLLTKKWSSIGRPLYFLNFITYFVFITAYTVFLVLERGQAKHVKLKEVSKVSSLYNQAGFSRFMPIFIMVFAIAQMVKELFQIVLQKRLYFFQLSNALEWALYSTVVVFLVPYVAEPDWVNEHYGQMNDPYIMWIIAVISIFLCYVNFVLFLRRFSTLGLYITMHMEVVKTLVKVMMVFIIFILCFAVVFFILFNEQDAFSDLGRSFVKVTIMMIGEIDYVTTFIDTIGTNTSTTAGSIANPQNPFPTVAFVFIFIFVFIMGIALMNLLVGLAVGDIGKVQREATLQRQAMQVEFVAQIEDKYPRIITRLVYKKSVIVRPNRVGHFARFRGMFGRSSGTESDAGQYIEQQTAYKELTTQLRKTKKRVKTILCTLEAQNRLLKSLAQKIDPSLPVDELDGEDLIIPETVQDDYAEPEGGEGEENDPPKSEIVNIAL